MKLKGDIKKLALAAQEQGWRVEATKNGHVRFVPPNPRGQFVIVPKTPSDHRSYLNSRALLRRQGLKV